MSSPPPRSQRPDGRAAYSPTNTVRAWATNAPAFPPQITLAAEDYNRMVRMIQQGLKLKMAVDLQVQFHPDDLMAYNTVAEIPGTDLKDEIVMLGAHLDSWHAGTGATDNGAGVAAVMEAARILKVLDLQAAPHDSRRPVERRGTGPAGVEGLRRPALRLLHQRLADPRIARAQRTD